MPPFLTSFSSSGSNQHAIAERFHIDCHMFCILLDQDMIRCFLQEERAKSPKTFATGTGERSGICYRRIGLDGNKDCGRSDRGHDTHNAQL